MGFAVLTAEKSETWDGQCVKGFSHVIQSNEILLQLLSELKSLKMYLHLHFVHFDLKPSPWKKSVYHQRTVGTWKYRKNSLLRLSLSLTCLWPWRRSWKLAEYLGWYAHCFLKKLIKIFGRIIDLYLQFLTFMSTRISCSLLYHHKYLSGNILMPALWNMVATSHMCYINLN